MNEAAPDPQPTTSADEAARPGFYAMALGSVGIVYGDIGTSPLYAFREAATAAAASGPVTREIVLGVLSMILWALILVVTVKYVLILLRADNNGEGGTLALMALAFRAVGRRAPFVMILGIIGAAMFLGDSVITPAISVLSAVEGLKLVWPGSDHFVPPIAVVILVALFALQRRGTAKVAAFFGPVMVIWFVCVAAAGLLHIADDPGVFLAINPYYAVTFLAGHGFIGLVTLGAVFLAVTGGEALYADLGHFGRKPIQAAWFGLVLPALVINYFGQGAAAEQPGRDRQSVLPAGAGDAAAADGDPGTCATVIASQAVITGAYSLTYQAIQLGLLPRLAILHTSAAHFGQIYIPRINAMLLGGVLLLVFAFQTSSRLAHAYGIAVTTTMVVDGLIGFIVVWKLWKWKWWSAALLLVPLVTIDAIFLSANLLKLVEGAWLPVAFGAFMVLLIITWQRGSRILVHKTRRVEVPMDSLIRSLEKKPPHLVPGTAVFLTSDPDFAPASLLHNLKHNKVLHERNIILTIVTTDTPRTDPDERVEISPISERFTRVSLRFGFMEEPNVPKALAIARKQGLSFDIMSTSFFLSRRSLKASAQSGMPAWQDRLFIGLARSANDATDFFQIPTGRVVEVGTQVAV